MYSCCAVEDGVAPGPDERDGSGHGDPRVDRLPVARDVEPLDAGPLPYAASASAGSGQDAEAEGGVQVEHAAAVAGDHVAVLADGVVVVPLRVEVSQDADLAPGELADRRVADLPGGGEQVGLDLLDRGPGDVVLLVGPEDLVDDPLLQRLQADFVWVTLSFARSMFPWLRLNTGIGTVTATAQEWALLVPNGALFWNMYGA